MTKQVRTSAGTSINSTKLPRVYNSFGIKGNIFDFGCGRYIEHIREAINAAGFKYYGFDPFNGTPAENRRAADATEIDYVVCSNVLNVIDSDDALKSTAAILLNLAKKFRATLVITVYEGDRSGIGRETKPDCYQRNAPLADYLKLFNVSKSCVKKGCIVIEP